VRVKDSVVEKAGLTLWNVRDAKCKGSRFEVRGSRFEEETKAKTTTELGWSCEAE
jgi:hypothetical protein